MAHKDIRQLYRDLLGFRTSPDVETAHQLLHKFMEHSHHAEVIELAQWILSEDSSGSDNIEVYLIMAKAWVAEGDLIHAQHILLDAIQVAPHEKEPYRLIADILLKRGDPARAMHLLDRALKQHGDEPSLLKMRNRAERFFHIAKSAEADIESNDIDDNRAIERMDESERSYQRDFVHEERPQEEQAEEELIDDDHDVVEPIDNNRDVVEPINHKQVNQLHQKVDIKIKKNRFSFPTLGHIKVIVFGLIVLLSGGLIHLGYKSWVHARVATSVHRALDLASLADYHSLIEADQLLQRVAYSSQKDPDFIQGKLFVQMIHILEEGESSTSALERTIVSAGHARLSKSYIDAARALVFFVKKDRVSSARLIQAISLNTIEDPYFLYLIGKLRVLHDLEDGQSMIVNSIERKPDFPVAQIAVATLSMHDRNFQRSTETLQKVLSKHPNHIRARLWLGWLRMNRENNETVLRSLEPIMRSVSNSDLFDKTLITLLRARSFRFQNKDQEALQIISSISTYAHRQVHLLLIIARLYDQENDALGVLQTLAPLTNEDEEIRILRAHAVLAVPSTPLAQSIAEELKRTLQESQVVEQKLLALQISFVREPYRGQEILVEAQGLGQIETNNSNVHRIVGQIALQTGNLETAMVSFRHAIELNPSDIESLAALANCELSIGHFAEAESHFQRLSTLPQYEQSIEKSFLKRQRAIALWALGRFEEAHGQLEALSVEEKDHPQAILIRARLAIVEKHADQAVELLRNRMTGTQVLLDNLLVYADALSVLGETQQASTLYGQVLASDPQNPEALIGYAASFLRAGKFQNAFNILERARRILEVRPRGIVISARLYALLGQAHHELGQNTEARTLLRQAVQYRGVPSDAWFFLGEALSGANPRESRAAYQQYLSLEPSGTYGARARHAIE